VSLGRGGGKAGRRGEKRPVRAVRRGGERGVRAGRRGRRERG
jgi:hypothetical protein